MLLASNQVVPARPGCGPDHPTSLAVVKVLIAGGAGYIGSTVASACLDAGITPVILDNLATGRVEFTQGRIFYRGDIADGALIDQIFADHPDIDAVVHAAALIVVPESVAEPLTYYRENVSKSIDFIEHLLRNGASRYLFSSSGSIYAPNPDFTVDESSSLAPTNPYSRTKVVMEMLLEDTTVAKPLRAISLRYFNPVGADPQLRTGLQATKPTHLLGRLLVAAENDEEFEITGVDWPTRDGTGIRDFIHVWDLAQAHVRALELFDKVVSPDAEQRYQVINLGTGSGTTVREFVSAFVAATGLPLRVREGERRPGDFIGWYTRSQKAKELLGWVPQLSIEDAIRDSQRWSTIRDERLSGA
jgi:UDP-glucose 4-epimerase